MLTLARELRGRYRVSLACAPSPAGQRLLEQAEALGVGTLALAVHGDANAEQLRRCLRQQSVEIFHEHAGIGWEGHAAIYAARAAGVPVVLRTEHLPYLITEPRQRRDHERLVSSVDCLVCVSEEARFSFVRAGVPPRKLRVIRNGILVPPSGPGRTETRVRLGLEPGAPIVLTVGRFTEQKGHRDLLAAVPAVLIRAPRARFLWAGRGPLEEELRQRVRALGLEPHVLLLGQRDDAPDLMAAADLFVLPSLFEGLPLVVLEAMAAGLPVVGTRVCGNAEVIVDGVTGRLVPPGQPTALAEAVLQVIRQPDLAGRWGRAGRRRVEREFSARRMATETSALYDELRRRRGSDDRADNPEPDAAARDGGAAPSGAEHVAPRAPGTHRRQD
jgi:glycosyltransferase involved in cell wall biosynthesis